MVSIPELKKYSDKKVLLQLNGKRKIAGVLKGYDIFLNVVLDSAVEITKNGNNIPLGSETVVRGNSIVSIESLDTII